MASNRAPLFGVEIKAGKKIINLPVYQGDSDISLLDRLYDNYPQAYDTECRQMIKNKVIESLENILKFEKISNSLKHNILQFLKKCKIDVKIIFQEQIKDEKTNKYHKSKNKQKRKTNKNKQNLGCSKSNKQFTKLYQITKNIFSNQENNISKEHLSKHYENRSTSKNKLFSKFQPESKSWKNFLKENESEILKRIQKKIKKYEKNFENHHNLSQLKNQQQLIDQVQTNQPQLTDPLQSNIAKSIFTEGVDKQNKSNRFKYNYNEIISERKISQGAEKNHRYNKSQRKSKIYEGVQFSRSYDDSESVLKFNYRQQSTNHLSQKYSYSINQISCNDEKISKIRRNSISYDKILFQHNDHKETQSNSNLRKFSTVSNSQDQKWLNSGFIQQKSKKFKYL